MLTITSSAASSLSLSLYIYIDADKQHAYDVTHSTGLFVGVADESALKNLNFTDFEAMGIDSHDLGAAAQGFTVLPTLLHPRSRGWVKLATSNPFDQPEIEPNYLTDERDVKTLIAGCKHASHLVTECEALSQLAAFAPAHPLLHPHIDAGTDIIVSLFSFCYLACCQCLSDLHVLFDSAA